MREFGRLMRGLASGLTLIGLIGGGAWALWHWGRLDAFRNVDWGAIWRLPDDGSLMLGLLTVVGWIAWLWITLTVIFELVAGASGGRVRPGMPGASWLRPAIAVLVMSILGLAVAASGVMGGNHGSAARLTPPSGPVNNASSVQDESTTVADGAAIRPYVVRPGDDLWSLAERFAGGGDNWREVADINQTVVLDPGVDLVPGTMLMVPTTDVKASPVSVTVLAATSVQPTSGSTDDAQSIEPEADQTATSVTVRPGDTLWGLADQHLGDPLRWPELYDANRTSVDDPALIHPGQVLLLPGAQGTTPPESTTPGQMSEATSNVDAADADPSPAPVELPAMAGTIYETSRPEAEMPADVGSSVAADGPAAEAGITMDTPESMIKALLGSISAGLAASMVVGLAGHRLVQLRNRPIGRALPRVSETAKHFETAMDRRAAGLLRRPDDCPDAMPRTPNPADPSVPGGRVTLGIGADGAQVPIDLLNAGLVLLVGDEDQTVGLMAALVGQLLAVEAERRPEVVLAAPSLAWLATLLDCPLTPVEQAWYRLRQHAAVDGNLEPLVVFMDTVAAEQKVPRDDVTLVASASTTRADANVVIEFVGEDDVRVVPDGLLAKAQLVLPPARRVMIELVDTVTSVDYPAAPWWAPTALADPAAGGSLTTEIGLVPRVEPAELSGVTVGEDFSSVTVADPVGDALGSVADPMAGGMASTTHPQLNLLGPVELVNARGVAPDRAARQCLEYCGWLLRYPGQTSVTMMRSLIVAEGTRRSNVSRLRLWLGISDTGEPYLPDAYSGRIRLHPGVTSDWEKLQTLIAGGVNRASEQSLKQALELVRGAPLADAAPGQWHWAEEWRCDMVSTIRDVGVVLANHALQRQDLDLARWAASRALKAAPEDDRLMAIRIRTEHLAGNHAEVERLALHVTRMARTVGFDLPDYMVNLLQEVIEGAPRMRDAA